MPLVRARLAGRARRPGRLGEVRALRCTAARRGAPTDGVPDRAAGGSIRPTSHRARRGAARYEVESALDGATGLARAAAFRPDVVICDIGLPGIDGYEVARRLRADPASCPAWLVAMSGYAAPDDVQRAREAGFDRHVPKPPTLERLRDLFREAPPRAP